MFTVYFKKQKCDQRLVMQILRDLGVREMKVMTNNPAHYVGLKGYGLSISGKVPLITTP
jgi:3,4-dihydroxy 2-butanone 4-phosphate synthase/GTP cyclohydrolase II